MMLKPIHILPHHDTDSELLCLVNHFYFPSNAICLQTTCCSEILQACSQNAKRKCENVTSFSYCGKTTCACQIWESSHDNFVLSHEMEKGLVPPTRNTQLSNISETGSGARDKQFSKKSNCL